MPGKIRFAIATDSISHFETPFFRLCAQVATWEFKVFYQLEAANRLYDRQYRKNIDWGVDLLAGYDSVYVGEKTSFAGALAAWHPDVTLVYGYGWPGAIALIAGNWLRGRAQIHRGTLNYFPDPRRGWKGKLMRPWRNLLFRMFTAHHYGGDYSRKVLLDAGVSPEAMFFVPYSVDTLYFLAMADSLEQQRAATAIREKLAWPEDAQVALFLAHHSWVKGPDIMLEVFIEWTRENPKARLLMVGSGDLTGGLQALAAAHLSPGQYHFAGFVPSAQTVPYYLAADIVVCTSRYETWARMINEAMCCRRPCLVNTRVAAAGGLVEDGVNGYMVRSVSEEPDVGAYVATLRRHFSQLAEERRKMGETAREKAREFSYEAHMDDAVAAVCYALDKVENRGFPRS